MDLRTEMMKRLANGERMTDLCREYGISRKTGNKFKDRFERLGRAGLADLSRAPHLIPHKTSPELVKQLVAWRDKHPSWGPKKLKETLERRFGREFPAASTIGEVLSRAGMVMRRGKHRPRHMPLPTKLGVAEAPNDIWCIDYKGQFRLGNGEYCYPLTVTDQFSRYILGVDAMERISDSAARDTCEAIFREHGLPAAMRSDNGPPFASTGLAGLTRLSAYWMQLGIRLERIRRAHPQDNGRHERMHRTLKFETTKPPRANLLQQQERFDSFIEEFNDERPHEALGMRPPTKVYRRSKRHHPRALPELTYPAYDDTVRVNAAGHIRVPAVGYVYVTMALVGLNVGIDEQRDGRWLVSFMNLDLGHIDRINRRVLPPAS